MLVLAEFPDLRQLRISVYTEPEAKSHVIVGVLSLESLLLAMSSPII